MATVYANARQFILLMRVCVCVSVCRHRKSKSTRRTVNKGQIKRSSCCCPRPARSVQPLPVQLRFISCTFVMYDRLSGGLMMCCNNKCNSIWFRGQDSGSRRGQQECVVINHLRMVMLFVSLLLLFGDFFLFGNVRIVKSVQL